MKDRLEPVLIFVAATFYYSMLSAFRYTWLFGSGDSGDWLASAKVWFVPQIYGSPFFITVAKIVNLFPGDLPATMTFFLSIIPAALSIALIYKVVYNLTGDILKARLSSLIMMGATILTTQAIIVEEYSFVLLMFCAALYFYSVNKHNWTVVFLGLAGAVHIIAVPIAFIFFVAHFRDMKYWAKKIPLYIVFGILPYGLILFLMWADTPRWLAGELSLATIKDYLSNTSFVGRLSLLEAPARLFYTACFMLVTFGAAIIPAFREGIKRASPLYVALFLTACFSVWMYATNLDWTTYTFLIYSIPCVAILAAVGITRKEQYGVVLIALVLIVSNFFLYNVERLDNADPIATTFYNETMSLPDGSLILTHGGGFFTMGLFHVITDGKDVSLVYLADEKRMAQHGYQEWLKWAQSEYGYVGGNSMEIVSNSDKPVYFVDTVYTDDWSAVYELEQHSTYYKKVVGIK